MQTIYKYPLEITDKQTVMARMSDRRGFAYVGNQNGTLCIWAAVDTEAKEVPIDVYVVGTGNPIPDEARTYIGSAIAGPFVWHVYMDYVADEA